MKSVLYRALAVAGMVVVFCLASLAQEKKETASTHKIVHSGDLKWTPIMKGCDLAPVSGNPDAEGDPYVVRIRCAAGSKVPAHWHPVDENVTVLKGAFRVGMGDAYDESKLQVMNPGNYALIAREMRHFGDCPNECIVQVHGLGPFKVNWVNPADVQPPDAKPADAKKSQ